MEPGHQQGGVHQVTCTLNMLREEHIYGCCELFLPDKYRTLSLFPLQPHRLDFSLKSVTKVPLANSAVRSLTQVEIYVVPSGFPGQCATLVLIPVLNSGI